MIIFVYDIFQSPWNTVHYRLIGDSQALSYFSVDKETGEVSLKKNLVFDTRQQYNVSWLFFF